MGNLAPEPVLKAALDALHWALVCCRNWTIQNPHLRSHVSTEVVYDLMEALHEIPNFLMNWDRHDVEELKMHLRCFQWQRWHGIVDNEIFDMPDLVARFEKRLAEFEKH